MSIMGHSTKSSSLHAVDAPAGYHFVHPSTAPASYSSGSTPILSPKNHKRFHSESQSHGATPFSDLEHSASVSSTESDSHKHHRYVPNPLHTVHDHMAEFRYGRTTRAAKREARKSQSHPWSLEAALARGVNVTSHERYEEVMEDWKEKDEQAWAAELRKREAAKKSCASSERMDEEVKAES